MRRTFLTVAIIVAMSTSVLLTGIALDVEATSERKSSIGDYLLVVDDEGQPRSIDRLETTVDEANRSVAITGQDSDSTPFWLYVRKGWLESIVPEPAFANRSFSMRSHNGTQWFGIRIPNPTGENAIGIRDFRPEVGRAQYTFGSRRSISLERPMFVSLSEVPGVRWEQRLRENRNGTWWERVPVGMTGLGIYLTDANTSGQVVTLSRNWLGTFGLANPYFQYADGTAIENSSDESHFYLRSRHFSILYAFTTSESFWKEDEGTYSNVFWDSTSRNIYVLSDRRDPIGTDERMRSPSPATYDETTSFTVRATWKTTQQGHWQKAVPLFFMGSLNTQVHSANSLYILYTSRASGSQSPRYYMRYVDQSAVLRMDSWVDAAANVQLEFSITYQAETRAITLGIYDSTGVALGTASYTLGTNEGFTLEKVGAGAWGGSDTSAAATIASVDNILVDANAIRNGGFEIDTNADGIPDRWQVWPGSQGSGARSSTRARSGVYSFRIDDSSSALSYGLQSERLYISTSSSSYAASVWVFVESGHFDLYLEFFNSYAGGTRIGVVFKSTTAIGEWEFLDLTMMAPTGTASVDVLVYSSLANTGIAYFDGAVLSRSRSLWSITLHGNNIGSSLAVWAQSFDRVRDLGIQGVRIDVTWDSVEPDPDVVDWTQVYWWRDLAKLASVKGLHFVAILGHNPAWISWNQCDGCDLALAESTNQDFLTNWRDYVTIVAETLGPYVYYYQMANEENHFAHNMVTGPMGHASLLFRYAYAGLLGGESATAADHKSGFKGIVNVFANLPEWDPALRSWLESDRSSIDIVAIDHYPGTWDECAAYGYWAPLDALTLIMDDYGKEGAVMETGFTTDGHFDACPPDYWHRHEDQLTFIDQALPAIRSRVDARARNTPTRAILLASWYELLDTCICDDQNRERHFGILNADWTDKPAVPNLRYQVSLFTL